MQFYRLERDDHFADAHYDMESVQLGHRECSAHIGHSGATMRVNELTVVLRSNKIGDIVWTWHSECMITDGVAELFRRTGLTGFQLAPVTISGIMRGKKDPRLLPKLWELQLRGWAGMARPESGIRLLDRCSACGYVEYSGMTHPASLIEESQWDGSDFFMVWPMPRFVFVAERVKALVRKEKLRGCRLIRVEDMPLIDGFGPGQLHEWMPDELAQKLGDPLGIY